MRYAPVALVLSALAALTASAGQSATPEVLDPRAAALEAQGRVAMAAGDLDRATDGFEAALAISPGSAVLVMDLAEVARHQEMPGKALHYYRAVLTRDPGNLDALAGEGQALAQKGAFDKAKRNLARLEAICGNGCPPARDLASALSSAQAAAARATSVPPVTPAAHVVAADAATGAASGAGVVKN